MRWILASMIFLIGFMVLIVSSGLFTVILATWLVIPVIARSLRRR